MRTTPNVQVFPEHSNASTKKHGKPKKAQENYQRDRIKLWREQEAVKVHARMSTLGQDMMPELVSTYITMKTNSHKWGRAAQVLSDEEKRALIALYKRAKRHQEKIIFDEPRPCHR